MINCRSERSEESSFKMWEKEIIDVILFPRKLAYYCGDVFPLSLKK